jgi:hypothetical protein
MYAHRFVVEGRGTFPYDMLRYDQCFPDTESDSAALYSKGTRRVHLIQYRATRSPSIEEGRWSSFGWKVSTAIGDVREPRKIMQ